MSTYLSKSQGQLKTEPLWQESEYHLLWMGRGSLGRKNADYGGAGQFWDSSCVLHTEQGDSHGGACIFKFLPHVTLKIWSFYYIEVTSLT